MERSSALGTSSTTRATSTAYRFPPAVKVRRSIGPRSLMYRAQPSPRVAALMSVLPTLPVSTRAGTEPRSTKDSSSALGRSKGEPRDLVLQSGDGLAETIGRLVEFAERARRLVGRLAQAGHGLADLLGP